jgi:hypothetical protein
MAFYYKTSLPDRNGEVQKYSRKVVCMYGVVFGQADDSNKWRVANDYNYYSDGNTLYVHIFILRLRIVAAQGDKNCRIQDTNYVPKVLLASSFWLFIIHGVESNSFLARL